MIGSLLKVTDHTVRQKVKVDLILFPFHKTLSKQIHYFEFEFIPICESKVREELYSLFPKSKLIKEVWSIIDFAYFTHIQWAYEEMERQRKTAPNTSSFLQIEIDDLKSKSGEKYKFFNTKDFNNFDFYNYFNALLMKEEVDKSESLKDLMYDVGEEYTFEYGNLIEATRNIARLRVIEGFTEIMNFKESDKIIKKKEELKLLLSQNEMDKFINSFQGYFHQNKWGLLYEKLYSISDLTLQGKHPESNTYSKEERLDFMGKQSLLVELFKRIRYHKKITPFKNHKTLGDWIYFNFNFEEHKGKQDFKQVSERTAEKYLAENERDKTYKEFYILRDQFNYIPPAKRPEE